MNARVPFMNLSVAWARLGHPNEGYKGKGGIVKERRATSGERDIEKGGERILQRNSVSKITLFYIDRSVFFWMRGKIS